MPSEIGNLTKLKKLTLKGNNNLSCFPTDPVYIGDLNISNTRVCCDDIDTTNINRCIDTGSTCTRPLKSCETVSSCDTEITDKELRQVIVDTLKAEDWGSVTTEDLESIEILNAQNRNIENIDGICKLKNLTNLNLYGNKVGGAIPTGIFNLTKLTRLNLSANKLSGEIPSEIGNLQKLIYLDYIQMN
jgi:Leucine-rich repeat (LRR) protein